MQRFVFYSGPLLVGYSNLEHGDPPMGVAFGEFTPTCGYLEIGEQCRANHADQSGLALSVYTETGMPIPCAGVAILDYSEADGDCIEASVLGIGYPLYEQLFPGRVIR